MTTYDYREAITVDIVNYICDHYDTADLPAREELEETLRDDLWTCDSVTGNASGSYTFNAWQAEEYLCHNLDLLGEALTEFGCEASYLMEHGAEAADVTIRCYLLGECIGYALDRIEEQNERGCAL